jgi:hypothetical protein
MEYGAMVSAYKSLHERLLSDSAIAMRIRNKMRHLRQPIYQGEYTLSERVGIVFRLITKGVLPGGFGRLAHFLHSLPLLSPSKLPQAIVDWISALAMRDYVARRFGEATAPQRERLAALVGRLRAAVAAYVERGAAAVSFENVAAAMPRLSLSIAGGLDRAFFAELRRHVDELMRHELARLTLRINALHEAEAHHLRHLLRHLARYGDRISIQIHERVSHLVRADSSVFHVVVLN